MEYVPHAIDQRRSLVFIQHARGLSENVLMINLGLKRFLTYFLVNISIETNLKVPVSMRAASGCTFFLGQS